MSPKIIFTAQLVQPRIFLQMMKILSFQPFLAASSFYHGRLHRLKFCILVPNYFTLMVFVQYFIGNHNVFVQYLKLFAVAGQLIPTKVSIFENFQHNSDTFCYLSYGK